MPIPTGQDEVTFLTPDDLAPFADIDPAKADAMIADVQALATAAAPCITTDGFANGAAVLAILRGVVLRWHETGIASYSQTVQGPPGYPVDPLRERRNLLWPSEIAALQSLCSSGTSTVYTTSLAGPDPVVTDIVTF